MAPSTTTPRTLPPQSVPPQTAPATRPGPSAEERAKNKVLQAGSNSGPCYPFPAPIEPSSNISFTTVNESPSSFVLTATTNSASNQSFVWAVDRATLAFTPLNDLAQVASNHCPGLN